MTAAPILLSLVLATGSLPNATSPLPDNERALLAALTNQAVQPQEAARDQAQPEPIIPETSPSVGNPTVATQKAVVPAGELARIAREKAEQARLAAEAAAERARAAELEERTRARLKAQAQRERLAQEKAARARKARKEVKNGLAAPTAAASVKTKKPAASEEINAAIRLAGFATVLALVLFGAAFFLKRIRTTQVDAKAGAGLTVLESMWIGKGQRILLVQVGSQQILLSATSAGVTTLAVFPNGARAPEARTLEPRAAEATSLPSAPSPLPEPSFQSMIQDEMRNPTPAPLAQAEPTPPVSQEHVQKLIRRLNTL